MTHKHLFITGFDPFGGETVNPAWEAVKLLPDEVGEYKLTKLEIPTVFGKAAQTVLDNAGTPDVILLIGQAGGRSAITPEKVAINLMHGRIADNEGNMPCDEPCIASGPDAYFSTLPVRAMADAIAESGIPGQVSLSAGAFVCNDTLYRVLHQFCGSSTRVGFIHVPFLPEQAKEGVPSMVLSDIVKGLTSAICALDK